MLKIDYLNPRMLIADEGKSLTNGTIYTPVVYLGADESSENWTEIDESEVPQEESEETGSE